MKSRVSEALEYLATSPDPVADAEMRKARVEEEKKIILAELMNSSKEKAYNAKETWARSQREYREYIEGDYAQAHRDAAFHRAKRAWAEATIEVWRTQNANKRAAERVR